MGLFDDLLEEEDKIQPTKRRGLFDDLLEEEDLVSPTAPPRTTAPQAQLLPPIEEMFKPKPKPTGDGFFRQAADIPVGLAKGAAQGVRMFTDIAGADNPVSQSIRGVEDYLGNLMSAQAKEDQAEIARIMQDAQDKGVLDQVMAGVKAFSVAPVDMTVQALGTMAPVIAGGLAANVAKVAATGIRGGVAAARGLTAGQMAATQAGIGAGMGAGVVKGTIYDEVKNELISQGLSEDAAHQQAVKAQEYGGKNLDQILLGAGLGAAAATTGAEKIIGGILTKTGVAASKSRIGNALKTGITEAFPEAAQGAQEQLAANLALQREGMEVPTTRGVFSSGALEGIAGFGVGAPLGAIQKASVAEDAAIKAEEANAPQTAAAIRAAGQKAATTEKDISATEQAIEETEAATRPTVPIREEEPYVQPPKEEFKAAFARMTPESIAETEANFREQLQSEDEETRIFSQNALDALAEFRAEQARARKLPTDVLPTETPGATYGREADIYDVFADIRRRPMPPSGPAFESAKVIEEAARRADILRRTPEGRELLRRELQGEEMVGGVRRATEEALATAPEPAEGDVFAEIRRPSRAEEAAITIEQQLAEDERIRRSQLGAEALREELAQVESLSRVADNTATDEEVVRLARQGLVNIQDGQNVITPRGEEVMQRGGAPLPRLTPEERAAEVAAPAEPTISEIPKTSEIVGAEPAAIVEQEPVAEIPAIDAEEARSAAERRNQKRNPKDRALGAMENANNVLGLANDLAKAVIKGEQSEKLGRAAARMAGIESLFNQILETRREKQTPVTTPPITEAVTPAPSAPTPAAPEVAPAKKIIAYRGDKAGIQEFEMKEGEGVEGDFGKGPYLSSSKRIATSYAAGADEAFAGLEVPKGREVYTTEVDIKKPLWVWYGGVTESSRMPEFFASKEFQALAERVRATKDESAIFNLERAIKENGFRNYKGATFALANPFGGWEKAKAVFKEVGFDGIAAQLGSDGDPSIQYVPFAKEQVKIVKEQPQVAPVAPAEAAPVGIAVGEPTEVAPPIRAEQPVIDPIGYGNALIDLFPTLKAAGVRAISMEESLADIERKWQQKQKSGKATRIDQLVYLANKKNTEDALAGNRVGGTWSRTDLRVAVSSSATPSAMAHEIGHAIMEIEFSKADKKTRDAIEAEYTKWFKEKYGKEGTPSVADQKRIWEWMEDSDWLNPKAPTPLEFRNPNWERYRSSFGEWFADEVAKWATTREKPKSLIDKFFSELAAKLSRLWNAVSENFSPNETLASWLDSITVASPSKVDPVTEGFQVGSRVGNKNARFLTYTIVEALPQNEAEKRNNERSYRVRDKKGKVTTMGSNDLVPLQERLELLEAAPEPVPAPEAVVEEAPAERPKRRTKMQNIIDISTGVKRPKTKLTVNEMTALKDQIRMGARKRKEDKQTQREFAKDVTQYLRDMTIRGKVSAPQLRAITSKAMQTQFDNEASIKSFLNYANRVIENANYDKDVAEAKKTLKRAQQLSRQKEGAANIKSKLAGVLDIDPRDIELDDMTERDVEVDGEIVRKKPISIAEFTAVLKEYMKALGPVTAEGYIVVPDQEFTDFVQTVRDQIGTNKAATDTIGMDGELAAIADKTAEQIDAELEADEERKNRIEQKVNKLAEDAQIALVKYDNPDLTDKEKEILDLLKRITLQDISIGNRKAYIQVANNILVNNKFFGAEKLSSIAAGQIGAAEAAKDSKQVKRNSASLNFLRTLFGENIPGSLLKFENLVNMSGQSFADAFRNFAGKQNMARFLYQIGFGKIEMGQAQANRERREITDNIQARFQQIEEQTKQKISDKQGIMSMGVASHLIQSTPDETEAEALTRMRNLIKQDIEKKKNAPDIEDRKDAAYIEKGLKEVDSDTVQGVLDNLKRLHPANYEALIFLKDEVLPEYKPLLKEHDELFNNQTDNYTNPNYLPIRYRAFTRALQKKEDIERRDNVGVTAPKQSPNSIKRVKNTVIPKDRQFDYNITKNVLDSLSIGLEAARTNAGWEQVNAFLESPNAEAAFDGPENLQFFKDRLSSVRRARLRKVYKMDGWDRLADVFANFIRTVGGGMVLGGFGQALKQYPAQFATTIANVNDLSITNQALVDIKAATPLMQMFSIGERGEIAGGSKWANQLEGNFSKLEQYMNEGALPKIKSAFEKFNDIWLLALKKSDTAAAAHGWISYYRKYLKDNNIPFTSWDNEVALAQNNDKDRVQAGLYADQMIDLYQGSSDPTKMAVFAQRGDSGGGNLLKAMIIPFSSFVIQERSRYMSDIRDLSYGDTQERKDAIKGLIATTAGILLFHTVRRYALPLLTGGLATGVYALLGVDMEEPDEEEKKKQEDKVFRQFLGEIAANILVGGYSSMAENALIDTVNRMAYFHDIYTESDNVLNDDGEVMKFETYRKERAPMYRYTGPGADSALGMVDILPSQLSDNLDKLMDLADEELMDSLSVEEQMVLILAAFSETIYTLRLNDADVDRMFSRMSKEVKEQAEDRARAQRALQRIYGQ